MDRELFKEARQSFLFHDGDIWVKSKNPEFDVAMGAFDGAEVCELVGLFLLKRVTEANIGLTKENLGLYRDDGLAVTHGKGRQMKIMTEKLHKIFGEHKLKIKAEEGRIKSIIVFQTSEFTLNLKTTKL